MIAIVVETANEAVVGAGGAGKGAGAGVARIGNWGQKIPNFILSPATHFGGPFDMQLLLILP
jgi:hypothetical protein